MGTKIPLTNNGGFQLTYNQRSNPGGGIVTNTGADWFGPLNPMLPIAPPDVKGRILDYPNGYNLNVQPRSYHSVTFPMLRAFADSYDLLRIVIETRKDQMAKLTWNVVPRNKSMRKKGAVIPADMEARCTEIEQFFLMPDKENFWDDWLRMLLEDLFVLDAPTLFRRRTYGGEMFAYQALDGGLIKRVIDDWGNTPEPPDPAYQQILKGYPAVNYTSDELIYRPRVKRTNQIYGFSPVEQIIMTVNIGLRRQTWQLETFTEGNIPEALIGTPDTWTPDQVRQFQEWFDMALQGNTAERSRARFVPGGVAKGYVPTKPTELFGQAEEWLARVVCHAFSISPQPFVAQMNRATAETAQETAVSEGLAPIQNWVKSLINYILIRDFNAPDLEFVWEDGEELDPNIKSQIVDREQAAGRLTYNEARREMGDDPYDHPDADRPMFKAATGWTPIFLTPEEQAAKDAAAAAISGAPGADGEEGDGGGADEAAGGGAADDAPPPPQAEKLAKGYNEDQPRDELGRFGEGGGAGAVEGHGGSDPSGHGGGTAPAVTSHKEAYDHEQARQYQENAAKARADTHAAIAANPGMTQKEQTDHYREREKHYDGERQKAYSAGRKEAINKDKEARRASKGVAQKGDTPFHKAHVHGAHCGSACSHTLAKAGKVISPSKGDKFPHPLRPFARKTEKKLSYQLYEMLTRVKQSVVEQVRYGLTASNVQKAEYPDDFDLDQFLEDLDLDAFALSEADLSAAIDAIGADSSRIALSQLGQIKDNEQITEQVNQRALDYARDRSAELVSFGEDVDPLLVSSTRDMIRATIAQGIEDNLATGAIADLLEENYAFSEERADTIAATEITTANSMGALASYEEAKAAGVSVKKSWLILEDACDICQENADAGAIDLDEDFPSGDPAPGAHPHCRCVLVPEVEDEDGNVTEGEAEEGDDADKFDNGDFHKRDNRDDMETYFPVDASGRGPIWAMGGNTPEATAEREESLLQFVPFEDCVATQFYCDHDKVELYTNDPTAKGFEPMAYFDGVTYFLQDGHHRAVASKLSGNAGMSMSVKVLGSD